MSFQTADIYGSFFPLKKNLTVEITAIQPQFEAKITAIIIATSTAMQILFFLHSMLTKKRYMGRRTSISPKKNTKP